MKFLRAVLGLFLLVPCLVYVGWFTNNSYLKSVIPGLTVMNPLTAFCMLLLGASLAAKLFKYHKADLLIKLAGVFVLIVGVIMLIKYIFGVDLKIDRLLFHTRLGPNRLSPNSAANFILIGAICLLYQTRRLKMLLYCLLAANAFISVLSIVGYLYGLKVLFGIANFNPMAIHTASEFLLLDILILGVLFGIRSIYVSTKIIVSLLLTIVVVSGVSVFSERSLRRADADRLLSDQADTTIAHLEHLQISFIDAETGQRGYLLTGKSSYLAPYNDAISGINSEINYLQKPLNADSRTSSDFISIRTNAKLKLAELEQTIHLKQKGQDAAALKIVDSDIGKHYLDTIRSNLKDIEGIYQAAQTNRGAVAAKDDQTTIWLLAVSTALNAVFLVIAFLFIQKALKDRIDSFKSVDAEKTKLTTLLESIGDGVFAIDSNKRITLFNKAAAKISAINQAGAIGKPYQEVLRFTSEQSEEVVDDFVNEALSGKQTSMMSHTQITRSDGHKVPVSDSAAPIFNVQGKVVGAIIVFRDASAQRELDQAKDKFVSLVSHQLRTPLTSIRLFAEMIEDKQAGPLNEQQVDYVHKISVSTERMIRLVGDILNTSRIELNRIMVEPTPTKLPEFVKSIVDDARPLAEEKRIKLSLELPSEPSADIPLDQTLLGQVVHNLLTNAIRYTKASEGDVHVKLTQYDDHYQLDVADNGIGIPPEAQSHLFQQFYRADNAVKAEGEGTGLGLYLVRMICKVTGCQISYTTKENVGTTFSVTIPLKGMSPVKGEKSLT